MAALAAERPSPSLRSSPPAGPSALAGVTARGSSSDPSGITALSVPLPQLPPGCDSGPGGGALSPPLSSWSGLGELGLELRGQLDSVAQANQDLRIKVGRCGTGSRGRGHWAGPLAGWLLGQPAGTGRVEQGRTSQAVCLHGSSLSCDLT